MTLNRVVVASFVGCLAWSSTSLAGEQVYRPTNPTFGGNSLNGSFLLSTAQAQGKGVKSGQQSPDLSGLTQALSGIGSGASQAPVVVIGGNGLPVVPASP